MTKEEETKRADEIVSEIYFKIDKSNFVVYPASVKEMVDQQQRLSIEIAILHVEKIVEATRDLRSRLILQPQNWNTVVEYFNEWQQILQNLKERIK